MKKQLIAKPKKNRILLINGGQYGSVSLHPKQKWEVVIHHDTGKIYLYRDCFAIIIDKTMFDECFYVTIPE